MHLLLNPNLEVLEIAKGLILAKVFTRGRQTEFMETVLEYRFPFITIVLSCTCEWSLEKKSLYELDEFSGGSCQGAYQKLRTRAADASTPLL